LLAQARAGFRPLRPLDGSVHDRLQGIPREAQDGSSGFDVAAGLTDVDGKGFEDEGEST